MRNITVLGDVRVHSVETDDEIAAPYSLMGGALMMSSAIKSALAQLDASSCPQVLDMFRLPGRDAVRSKELDRTRSEIRTWQLRETNPEGLNSPRYRLCEPYACGLTVLPEIRQELTDLLGCRDFIECLESCKPQTGHGKVTGKPTNVTPVPQNNCGAEVTQNTGSGEPKTLSSTSWCWTTWVFRSKTLGCTTSCSLRENSSPSVRISISARKTLSQYSNLSKLNFGIR